MVRRTHLELHEVHCVQILLLHVHPAHAVAHAARLLVLVLPANNFFNLLGHLSRGQLARDVASEGGAGRLTRMAALRISSAPARKESERGRETGAVGSGSRNAAMLMIAATTRDVW